MDVSLRLLEAKDINQVSEIEREAFSPLWAATPFKRGVNNRNAMYLVACCPENAEDPDQQSPQQGYQDPMDDSLWDRVARGVRRVLNRDLPSASPITPIVGYVSIWFQGDEAHITEIAVREKLRGNGIGELLLIGSVRAAVERGSSIVTLEARVSNFIAQRLYEKYGFKSVGLRKAYYLDNREDAVIMSTSSIHNEEYRRMFQQLQQAYGSRWREISIDV